MPPALLQTSAVRRQTTPDEGQRAVMHWLRPGPLNRITNRQTAEGERRGGGVLFRLDLAGLQLQRTEEQQAGAAGLFTPKTLIPQLHSSFRISPAPLSLDGFS